MSHADTALLVVDAQESFRHRAYWQENDVPAFLERLQALVDGAKAMKMPIIQIFHSDEDEHFRIESGLVRTMSGLQIQPDTVIIKRRHSAFMGTDLAIRLTENGIRNLIVCGIRTEQCCETTTRNASDLGFQVDFVTEATLTFPMSHASGETFTAQQIKTRTELVLAGRFARIATVEQALAGVVRQEAA